MTTIYEYDGKIYTDEQDVVDLIEEKYGSEYNNRPVPEYVIGYEWDAEVKEYPLDDLVALFKVCDFYRGMTFGLGDDSEYINLIKKIKKVMK
ncbi:MAG: hypothetical protein EOM50_12190 [Erysipelotrichia bacterium]|nr:hypothetical protein [Erysipelotrichia bacterium]